MHLVEFQQAGGAQSLACKTTFVNVTRQSYETSLHVNVSSAVKLYDHGRRAENPRKVNTLLGTLMGHVPTMPMYYFRLFFMF